jgi:hypothetical protein
MGRKRKRWVPDGLQKVVPEAEDVVVGQLQDPARKPVHFADVNAGVADRTAVGGADHAPPDEAEAEGPDIQDRAGDHDDLNQIVAWGEPEHRLEGVQLFKASRGQLCLWQLR